jgi:quinolinate synthase
MSSYLHVMNSQVWWMVDVDISHAIETFPQTQGQKKCLYLKAHTSNALSSALSAEIKNNIEIEYDLLERANLLRLLSKCLAQAMIRDHHQ